jgi:hypoxanthine phosphoribosyltransferase
LKQGTPDCAVFDADCLSTPLIIRAWQAGDRIHPRGMRGKRKKLQDLFTDMKVSRDERSRIPLIVAPEGIVWVVGRRQDERCAVGKDTRRCLVVKDKMERIFGRPIVTQEEMRARIKELGKQIANDYAGKDLVLVGVLKGAYAFYADLARAIRIPMRVDFLIVASYGSQSKTSGKVKVITELTEQIKGKDVLLVEDIVDSGLTVEYLIKTLSKQKPKSIKVCTLLSKPERRTIDVPLDYVGFKIPNKYVVGYGLDYQQKYRNLPYLAELDMEGEQE